jgi:hypothetical protein
MLVVLHPVPVFAIGEDIRRFASKANVNGESPCVFYDVVRAADR